jgi:hypothetical protein
MLKIYGNYPELRELSGAEVKAILKYMAVSGRQHKIYLLSCSLARYLFWAGILLAIIFPHPGWLAVWVLILVLAFVVLKSLHNNPVRAEFNRLYPAWLLVHKRNSQWQPNKSFKADA